MAFGDSNINIKYPNFCIGPQAGTFCTINQDSVTTVLRIKNEAGGLIGDYALSSNIIDEVVMLEYVGPTDLTFVMDGATFFTAEKVSSSICLIKRWEIYLPTASLNLKQQIVKYTTGHHYYDTSGMAVEHYRRTFDAHNPGGINYLDISSASRITNGMRLFLGPSTDTDNPGEGEYVTVSHTVGDRVYLTSNIIYQYVSGNPICFYNNFYLVSSIGFAGVTTQGSMYKLNAYSGAVVTVDSKGMYQGISGVRWSSYVDSVACIHGNNVLFVSPYNFYLNWKSIYLNNLEDDRTNSFTVEDIVFDDYVVYKLTQKTTGRDDSGTWTTYNWNPYYNFQPDTLLPYSNNLKLYSLNSKMIGGNDTTTIYIQLRDQFGVGLLNKTVNLYKSGDVGAEFSPISGQVVTDANGEASVGYTSGSSHDGWTEITGKVDGSSPSSTGSQYVWNSTNIDSNVSHSQESDMIFQWDNTFDIETRVVRQISDQISNIMSIFGRTYFTIPGGDWLNPSNYAGQIAQYLPTLHPGPNDGPAKSLAMGWDPGEDDPPSFENRITQVLDFESERPIQQLGAFSVDFERLKQIGAAENDLQISQLKLSKHTHWVGGVAYDYLWTQVSLDQFIFVEDAIPKFWSEKNPINTNIWIRLRPFAFDLDQTTLVFKVREISYAGDTGYQDVTTQCIVTTFDAGGGIDGLDILYNPPQDFHHNAIVYVHIEVYDMAPTPNYIYTDYWFMVIPDFRFPYLDNLNPSREQDYVSVDSNIYFEIKDEGVGVDISTLEMCVNSRKVEPTTVRINNNQYNVTYNPIQDFYYNKEVTVHVRVKDSSVNENELSDSYRFYTVESGDILFTGFDPAKCKRGFPIFQDVSFLALGMGNGVDKDTLRVQIRQQDVDDKVNILPVIYRVS